jgi:hypothetical protein
LGSSIISQDTETVRATGFLFVITNEVTLLPSDAKVSECEQDAPYRYLLRTPPQ